MWCPKWLKSLRIGTNRRVIRVNRVLGDTELSGKCALSSLRRVAGVRGQCLVTVRRNSCRVVPNGFCIQTFVGRCTSAIKLSNSHLLKSRTDIVPRVRNNIRIRSSNSFSPAHSRAGQTSGGAGFGCKNSIRDRLPALLLTITMVTVILIV